MRRLAPTRSAITACLVLVFAAGVWSLVTARWVPDWLSSPHYRATITDCDVSYEVPADRDPRSCYANTPEGVVHVYGAEQGEEGDDIVYILTDDRFSQPNGRPIAYSPTRTDRLSVAAALTTFAAAVLGLATITYRRIRPVRSPRRTASAAI